ncbi:uncharacterized protein LOC103488557 isoform X3 [Cucumis melo]|nr:uncharacterized protein LOC103488557 isoform X3 [Cucumis melo]XP_050938224.1 uncharacterized protein LOC103488557 isoform X3 [Cucumis melo]XP_050938225.1 uncharacterized protein LOC103488557 isoform X3 [Cucumis melo]XP_050938226.1 uncharacterized protein LOC103488557 isoform X3 [Cucumis melo]
MILTQILLKKLCLYSTMIQPDSYEALNKPCEYRALKLSKSFWSPFIRAYCFTGLYRASKPTDFEKLDNYMHQFKGSSSSIGANRVTDACSQFREYCLAGNLEGCMRSFQQVKQEHEILKKKLDTYFQLVRQAGKG